jgi:hypothetical protein
MQITNRLFQLVTKVQIVIAVKVNAPFSDEYLNRNSSYPYKK